MTYMDIDKAEVELTPQILTKVWMTYMEIDITEVELAPQILTKVLMTYMEIDKANNISVWEK